MDPLKPLAVFAATVDAGSMSGAARRLGTSAAAVSQTIRALEERSGVTLLHRSTRKLALTEVGERYYPHCKRVLEAARAAADSLQRAREAPTGELRVSAPVGFAIHIAPALAPLLAEAPHLRLRLLVDDAMIDLIDARIDVAVRVGRLPGSSWVARRLGDLETILCASPDYLERHGTPTAPRDLAAHQWLAFIQYALEDERDGSNARSKRAVTRGRAHASPVGSHSEQATLVPLELRDADGRRQHTVVEARVASNNQVALQQMCEHGLGIAHLVRADVLRSLHAGSLTQLLAPWRMPTLPVWALTPRRDSEAKVRAALKYLRSYFAVSRSRALTKI